MSKKGEHQLLRRLIVLTQHRLPFAAQIERYRRQRQWLIDLAHLLDPERDPPKTSSSVTQMIETYLLDLTTRRTHDAEDRLVANHINQTFRSFWWGLFRCYDVPGLPRTNNELERFMRQIKMGQYSGPVKLDTETGSLKVYNDCYAQTLHAHVES